MTKQLTVTVTCAANTEEDLLSHIRGALKQVDHALQAGMTGAEDNMTSGDDEDDLEWAEAFYNFKLEEI